MIEDPIVIRKSRGNLIISAVKAADPVQLIRQLDNEHVEVHLKNGSKYVEDVTEDNLEETVLELMGFRQETLAINFDTWPRAQDCRIDFSDLELPMVQNIVGKQITDLIFTKTPYIHSKFVEFAFEPEDVDEVVRDYYDDKYGKYSLEFFVTFWTRVDAPPLILTHCWEIRHDIATAIMRHCKRLEFKKQKHKRILDEGCNEFSFYFLSQD